MAPTRDPLMALHPSRAGLACVILGLSCLAACQEPTVLTVQVLASSGVGPAAKLSMTFSSPSESSWQRTFVPADGVPLFAEQNRSEVINIVVTGRRGPVTLSAEARDDQDNVIGSGEVDTAIREDRPNEVVLEIRPSDKRLNSRSSVLLSLTSTSAGRQLASASDESGGTLLAASTWQHCDTNGCEIVARAFDGNGLPLSSSAGSAEELFVTRAVEDGTEVDMPAIAAARRGFAVVYQQKGLHSGVFARGYTLREGSVSPAEDKGTRISCAEASGFSTPDIAALSEAVVPPFAATWAETRGSTHHFIMAQRLGEGGLAARDGDTPEAAAVVAKIAVGRAGLDTIRPAIAGGRDGSFMVAWIDSGAVWARRFDKRGQPASGPVLADSSAEQASSVDIAPLVSGYVLVWDDIVPGKEGARGHRGIQVRRFDDHSEPLDNNEYTLSDTSEAQRDPAVAVDPDGRVLITWVALEGGAEPVGELRSRLLLSNGMPFGDAVVVESDMASSARLPSIATMGRGSFVISTLDKAGDEQSQGGVTVRRDQIIGIWHYPELRGQQGLAGHSCDEINRCKTLVCANIEGLQDRRCVAPCREAGEECPLGGRCLPLDEKSRACLYDF